MVKKLPPKLKIPRKVSSGQSEEKKSFFIETIARYCDKCGTPYNTEDVQIIQESNFSSIIHFACSNCKSTHIASFIRPVGVSSRMPVNCDLEVEEISKFANKAPISLDDVLEVYSMIDKNDRKINV